MISSREIPLHSSRLPNQKYYQRRGRWKYYRTMWHCLASFISQCRTVRVTSMNSLPMRYNHSLLLSDFGMLYLPGTKSDLLPCFGQSTKTEPPSTYDCKVLDGSVFVHCLPTFNVSTFNMYADKMLIPHLERHLQDTKRLDGVSDEYIQDSLKESTGEKRGKGVWRKVSGSTKIPGNWKNFLGDQMNKT